MPQQFKKVLKKSGEKIIKYEINRAECYRMVHKLVLILINHTHNIYHNLNAHISIRVSAASAHQQHQHINSIGATAK